MRVRKLRFCFGLVLGGLACACAAAAPGERHLVYFHGKIIEDQGLPAVSAEFGEYQFAQIVARFEAEGFIVHAEIRGRAAAPVDHADAAASWIRSRIDAGVAPDAITVVGASKGAFIASLVSHLIPEPGINYVFVAGCAPAVVDYMLAEGLDLHGDVLTIRDVADVEIAGSCAAVFSQSLALGLRDELVVHEGVGHGLVYRPYDSWILPTIAWALEE